MDNRREFLRKTGAVILGLGATGATLSQAQVKPHEAPKPTRVPKYLWHKATNQPRCVASAKKYTGQAGLCWEIEWPRPFELIVAFQTGNNEVIEVAYFGFNVSDYRVDYLNHDPLDTHIKRNAYDLILACSPCGVDNPSTETFMYDFWDPVTGEALVEFVEKKLRVAHLTYCYTGEKNGQS